MRKRLGALLIVFSFVFAANAYSAEGLYISGNIGLATLNDADANDSNLPGVTASREFDTGAAFSGAIGYGIENFRLEGEIGYQKNDFNEQNIRGTSSDLSGDLTSLSFLVNTYYDFPTGSKFTPFITAGLGFAQVDVNDLSSPGARRASFDDDDTVFAGQVGAGVSYALNEKVDFELKYRYFMTEDLEFSDGGSLDGPNSHNVYLGMRYTF